MKQIQLKTNHEFCQLNQLKSNRKPIKSDTNLPVTKLGMIKSCIKTKLHLFLAKRNNVQNEHRMTEAFE
jgi:hypothetical protein